MGNQNYIYDEKKIKNINFISNRDLDKSNNDYNNYIYKENKKNSENIFIK